MTAVTVGPEDRFAHVRDVAVIDVDVDVEVVTPEFADELSRSVGGEVRDVQLGVGVDLEDLVRPLVSGSAVQMDFCIFLDGHRVLAHVLPMDVLEGRIPVDVDAVGAGCADHDVSESCPLFEFEDGKLTLVLGAIAQMIGMCSKNLATTIVGLAGANLDGAVHGPVLASGSFAAAGSRSDVG